MNIENIQKVLLECYSKDLCYPKVQDGWSENNKCFGMCAITSLIINDYFGGDIFETTFLESVKCYPLMQKNLKTCSSNCKNIMLEQLRILNLKLIITLGEFTTRNLLNFKFNKFSDVVGIIYEVNGYKILPIYHPSQVSPKSYKGNIPILEKLKLTNNF